MARTEKEYRRLPGTGLRTHSLLEISRTRCTLWLGKDHLLNVDSLGGYSEDYKRFYYRDIQAIVIRKTGRGRTINLVMAGFAALFLLAGLPNMADAWRIFWFFIAGLMLTFLLINWALGPTCVCHLRTAVQTEGLPSLNRLRTARKALARLRPLVEQAQGRIAPESLPAQVQEFVIRAAESPAPVVSVPVASTPGRSAAPPKLLVPYRSRAHAVLFSLLLVEAARQGVHLFHNGIALALLEMLSFAAVGLTLIVAFIKQQQTDLSADVRRVTWGIFGLAVISVVTSYVGWTVITVRNPAAAGNHWELLQIYSGMSALESGWLMGLFLFNLVCALLLGAAGLYYLQQYRHNRSQPPPTAPPVPPPSSTPV